MRSNTFFYNEKQVWVFKSSKKMCNLFLSFFLYRFEKIITKEFLLTTLFGPSHICSFPYEAIIIRYSQTWVNDHHRIATTCIQRPPFRSPVLNFYCLTDLWTTTTYLQRPLFWGIEGGRCTLVWQYLHIV